MRLGRKNQNQGFYVGADAVQAIDASRENYDCSIGQTSGVRYVTSDPIGLDGGINTYRYSESNSLKLFDNDGLKARVCCRLVPFIGRISRARHCYIEREQNGNRDTWGLISATGGPSKYARWFKNNDFDQGGICGPWVDTCKVDSCVESAAESYPNPSKYKFATGPNSNTYAGTVARKCGLEKGGGWAPGYNKPPAEPYTE